jgi:hypothetical protein
MLKKLFVAMALGVVLVTNAFAGSEDWNGTFTVQDADGEMRAVVHTPTSVQFLFFSAGRCLRLGKGVKINGMTIPEDVVLCTNATVEKFVDEVQKLGVITNKKVTLGPTYKP